MCLEQLRNQITTSTSSTLAKQKAAGLVANATSRLTALGVNMATADSAGATSVAQAIGMARANVLAQTFSSNEQKWRALGEIDRLAGEVTAALNS